MTEIPDHLPLFLRHQIPEFLPWYLLAAQAYWESGFERLALSKKGAWGYTQFMPGTWDEFGEGSPLDIENAIQAQVNYMRFCAMFLAPKGRSSFRWLLAAYCWGHGAAYRVDSWAKVPESVRNHAERILRTAREYKDMFPQALL